MNMKKLSTLCIAVLASAIFVSAQMMPDSTVQVCAYWAKGDHAEYQCMSHTVKVLPDGIEENITSSSETRIFDVIEATDTSYVLKTTYKDVFCSPISLQLGAEAFNKIAEADYFYTLTNEFGTPKDIIYIEETIESMRKFIPICLGKTFSKYTKQQLKQAGIDKQAIIDNLTESLCTPEAVTKTCMTDVIPLLKYHGSRLKLNEEYSFKQTLNDVMGAGNIEADTNFWVDMELTDSTKVLIRSYTEVGSEKMMPYLKQICMNYLQALGNSEISDNMEEVLAGLISEGKMSAAMEEYSSVCNDLADGWPIMCWTKRIVTIDNEGKKISTVSEADIEYITNE